MNLPNRNNLVYISTIFFIVLILFHMPVGAVSAGPSLTITGLTGEEAAYQGYPYQGTVTVRNSGDQTSGITTPYIFFTSPDNPDLNATISALPVDPIRPGTDITLPYIGTVSKDLPSGQYYVYGYVKGSGRNPEKTGTIARITSPVPVLSKPLPDREALHKEIISTIRTVTNQNRIEKGLRPLIWDENLANIAEKYAEESARTGRLSHTDKNGDGPSERAKQTGYPVTKDIEGGVRIGIAENLAYIGTGMVAGVGYVDPTNGTAIGQALMDGWMKSPGHRKNILDPLADRFGAGLFWNGEYYYAVSEFW
ncbi:MAG TPA: CAP domain-containing protein [Methanospirillum sp.]|nr:CAP domain-containing protein [Methanospirillum sp.]